MKRCAVLLVLAGVIVALSGCNTMSSQPRFERAGLEPPVLAPGTTGLLLVKLKDKHHIVSSVTAMVPEYPNNVLKLNDDGTKGDEKAGDGVWSFAVKVPQEATEGEFAVQIAAWRSDGVQISVRDKQGNVTLLSATIPARVQADMETAVEPDAPMPEGNAPAAPAENQ